MVAATRAGWSNLPLLFRRCLEQLVEHEYDAFGILMNLLDLPIPGDADEGRARGWPDPFRLLVRVFNPSSVFPPREMTANAALRPIGDKLVARVRTVLKSDPTRVHLLLERSKTFSAIAIDSRVERQMLLSRRLKILEKVLAAGSSPATPPKRRRKAGVAREILDGL